MGASKRRQSGLGKPLPTGPLPEDLVASVLESPDDDGPRLVLADALLAKGDPRGELITIQCALAAEDRLLSSSSSAAVTKKKMTKAKRTTLERAARKLLKEYSETWKEELGLSKHYGCTFRRGFIERVEVAGQLAIEPVTAASKRTPIRELELTGRDTFIGLLNHPLSDRLTSLGVTSSGATEDELKRLSSSKITSFKTRSTPFGVSHIAVLASWPTLTSLAMMSMPIPVAVVRAIVASSLVDRLVTLDLRCQDNIGEREVAGIVAKAPWKSLTSLTLVQFKIDDDGAVKIANARGLKKLEALGLALNRVGNHGGKMIASSSILANLHTLSLSFNQLGPGAAQALALPTNLPALKWLDLSYNGKLSETSLKKCKARLGRGFDG